jgi:CheY-like chemotaxis protein
LTSIVNGVINMLVIYNEQLWIDENYRATSHANILLVEDNKVVGEAVKSIEPISNYIFFQAYSASEALALLKDQKIDLIISNLRMAGPGLTCGTELCNIVKFFYPSIYFFIFTGDPSPVNRLRAKRSGVDAFILKPCSLNEIRLLIEAVLLEPILLSDTDRAIPHI